MAKYVFESCPDERLARIIDIISGEKIETLTKYIDMSKIKPYESIEQKTKQTKRIVMSFGSNGKLIEIGKELYYEIE